MGERPESPNAVNSLGDGVAEEGAWAHGARDQSRSPHPREVGGVAGPRVMASLRRPLRQRSGRRRLIALPSPFPHGSDGRFAATHERPPLAKVRQTYRRMGLAVVRCLNRAATFGSGFRWRHQVATAPASRGSDGHPKLRFVPKSHTSPASAQNRTVLSKGVTLAALAAGRGTAAPPTLGDALFNVGGGATRRPSRAQLR